MRVALPATVKTFGETHGLLLNGMIVTAHLFDISGGGLGLRLPHPIPCGTRVTVDSEITMAVGEVCWCELESAEERQAKYDLTPTFTGHGASLEGSNPEGAAPHDAAFRAYPNGHADPDGVQYLVGIKVSHCVASFEELERFGRYLEDQNAAYHLTFPPV